jgi:hypothetical protein
MKDNYQFNGTPKYRNSILWAPIVNASAKTYKLDPNALGATIETESSWDLKAKKHYSTKYGSGEVNGLGSIQDRNQSSAYKNGDQNIQIPEVAKYMAGCYLKGSKDGDAPDIDMCYHYYGLKSPNDDNYYKTWSKHKSDYEAHDIPIVKNSKDTTGTGVVNTSTVIVPRISLKGALTNIKTSVLAVPNKVMTFMGVSALGLIAIIVLISQATISNDEKL